MPRSRKPRHMDVWLSKKALQDDIEIRRMNQDIHGQPESTAAPLRTPPPRTPDHFWELEFPSTQECAERGYLELPNPTSTSQRDRPNRYERPSLMRGEIEETRDIMTDSTPVVPAPSQPDIAAIPDDESIASTASDAPTPILDVPVWRPNISCDHVEHTVLFPTLDTVVQHLLLCQRTPHTRSLVQNVSIRSLQLKTFMRCLPWADCTLKEDIAFLATRCIPLHPTCTERLAKLMGSRDEDGATLAQLFAPRDKLARIVGIAHKRNADTDAIEQLLAVDGLAAVGNDVRSMPNFDVKRYADRLRFGLIDPEVFDSGEDDEAERGIQLWWSRREGDERAHVRAVRFLYQVLAHDYPGIPPVDRKMTVFKTLRKVYRPYSEGLKKTIDDTKSDVETVLAKKYLEAMGDSEVRLQRLGNKLFPIQDTKRYQKKRKAADESDDETDISRD